MNPTPLSQALTEAVTQRAAQWAQLPILQGVRTGELDFSVFRNYLEQDYLYLRYYGRIYARLAAQSTSDDELEHFIALAHGVLGVELDHHRSAAAPFGCDFEAIVPSPQLTNYIAYYESIGHDRAATLVGMLPCTYGYGVALRLIKDGDLGPYREWVDIYTSGAYEHIMARHLTMIDAAEIDQDRALEIIERGLDLEHAFWNQVPAEVPA
jgi:thiaminase